MQFTIIKPDPDQAIYIGWSDDTGPCLIGTETELADSLVDYAGGNPHAGDPNRFQHADRYGTSSRLGYYGWDDEAFLVFDEAGEAGVIARDRLIDWMLADCPGTWIEPIEPLEEVD